MVEGAQKSGHRVRQISPTGKVDSAMPGCTYSAFLRIGCKLLGPKWLKHVLGTARHLSSYLTDPDFEEQTGQNTLLEAGLCAQVAGYRPFFTASNRVDHTVNKPHNHRIISGKYAFYPRNR